MKLFLSKSGSKFEVEDLEVSFHLSFPALLLLAPLLAVRETGLSNSFGSSSTVLIVVASMTDGGLDNECVLELALTNSSRSSKLENILDLASLYAASRSAIVMFRLFFCEIPELPASEPSESTSAEPERPLRFGLSVAERRIILKAGDDEFSDGTISAIRASGLYTERLSRFLRIPQKGSLTSWIPASTTQKSPCLAHLFRGVVYSTKRTYAQACAGTTTLG